MLRRVNFAEEVNLAEEVHFLTRRSKGQIETKVGC